MRDIGLHLRLTNSLACLVRKAVALQVPIFQCFFLNQRTNMFINPSQTDVKVFQSFRSRFNQLFVHASYWTNLSSVQSISLRVLHKELYLAKRLGFEHVIIHPGYAKGAKNKQQGIDALVRRLNKILKHEHDITLVLENTAHAKLSIGGDLLDFKQILQKIDHPEKISFCLDTVHAHVYGYSIANNEDQDLFFAAVEDTIGTDRIALIHLNNTKEAVGSCIDRHVLLTHGIISVEALKAFVLQPKIQQVPIIMELPIAGSEMEKKNIALVRTWHQ